VLADQLGVSPASVSLVLNRAPAARAIPPATQERIRAAATASGYRPNTIAKSLRHRRTLTVGVMVPEISEGYSALVMSGIEDALLQAGYLYFVASHRDHGRAAAQALAHLRALGHRRVAFIKGQSLSSDTAVRWQTIRAAARAERMAIDPALVGQLDGNSPLPDLGYMAARALLRVRPRATALFAFNDMADADPAAAV